MAVIPFEETDNLTVLTLPLLRRDSKIEKVMGDAVITTCLARSKADTPNQSQQFLIPDEANVAPQSDHTNQSELPEQVKCQSFLPKGNMEIEETLKNS